MCRSWGDVCDHHVSGAFKDVKECPVQKKLELVCIPSVEIWWKLVHSRYSINIYYYSYILSISYLYTNIYILMNKYLICT